MLYFFGMKDVLNKISAGLVSFLAAASGLVSIVAFVAWFSYGAESSKILYVSLPILMVTLPLILRRKVYFHFLWIWLIGPTIIGLLVISLKAIDTFLL